MLLAGDRSGACRADTVLPPEENGAKGTQGCLFRVSFLRFLWLIVELVCAEVKGDMS